MFFNITLDTYFRLGLPPLMQPRHHLPDAAGVVAPDEADLGGALAEGLEAHQVVGATTQLLSCQTGQTGMSHGTRTARQGRYGPGAVWTGRSSRTARARYCGCPSTPGSRWPTKAGSCAASPLMLTTGSRTDCASMTQSSTTVALPAD